MKQIFFERRDRWRKHPMLRATRLSHIFPGFGTALLLVGSYALVEYAFNAVSAPSAHAPPPHAATPANATDKSHH